MTSSFSEMPISLKQVAYLLSLNELGKKSCKTQLFSKILQLRYNHTLIGLLTIIANLNLKHIYVKYSFHELLILF